MKILFISIAIFCFLHLLRDYLQIKKGYTTPFTRIGHFWHAPQYEKHGMILFFLAGCVFLAVAFR